MPRRSLVRLMPFVLAPSACASTAQMPEASRVWQPGPADRRVAERIGTDPTVFGGLWTLETPPIETWWYRYGRGPDAGWLEHVRDASVRIGEYCSGTLVSDDGLVLTTQSCVRECIAATSNGRDDLERGVVARSAAEERVCPDLFVDRLVDVRDVTGRVAEITAGASYATTESSRSAAIRTIERECADPDEGRVCQVARLWNGARLRLYTYRRYAPVKLVLAAEAAVAGLGGGSDVVAWPRHALDFALLRIYDEGGRRPLRTETHLNLRTVPPVVEEPVFVVGSPISSDRLAALSQLWYEREIRQPRNVVLLEGINELLELIAREDESPDGLRDELYNVRSSLAVARAQLAALEDSIIVGARLAWEHAVRTRVATDPELNERFGDVWAHLQAIQERKAKLSMRLNASNVRLLGAPHLMYGADLRRAVYELGYETEAARRNEFLRMQSDIDPRVADGFLGVHVTLIARWIEGPDPIRTSLLLPGEQPADAIERLTRHSSLLDAGYRRQILEGGREALDAVADPLLRHAVVLDSIHDDLIEEWSALTAREAYERRRLAEAMLEVFDENEVAPDATYTLRIADGVVRHPDGDPVQPAFTTFYGLFEQAAVWPGQALPTSFVRRRRDLDLATPLNFVVTADAPGVGSAVIDGDGHLTGIVVGTNAEHVGNRFAFASSRGRVVAVHTAAIVAALSEIYRADRITRSIEIVKGKE